MQQNGSTFFDPWWKFSFTPTGSSCKFSTQIPEKFDNQKPLLLKMLESPNKELENVDIPSRSEYPHRRCHVNLHCSRL